MFKKYSTYSTTYEFQWAKTADLLERTVAIPIMVKMSSSSIESVSERLITIADELGL